MGTSPWAFWAGDHRVNRSVRVLPSNNGVCHSPFISHLVIELVHDAPSPEAPAERLRQYIVGRSAVCVYAVGMTLKRAFPEPI